MNAASPDPAELARFESHASQWWDPDGPLRTLHDINRVRLEYLEHHLPLAGRSVVDVGCGGGLLAEAMARAGARVLGIDAGERLVRVAELHRPRELTGLHYRVTTAEALAAERPGEFDLVTCMELVEHVPDAPSLVTACAGLARPGGVLVFSTLNRTARAFVEAIVAAEHLLHLLPRGTHDYARLVRPSELARWLRAAHCEVEDVTGIGYQPWRRQARLRPDPAVNYLLLARRR